MPTFNQSTGTTLPSARGANATYFGEAFTPSSNVTLTKVTIGAGSDNTIVYVHKVSDSSLIAQANLAGTEATFNAALTSGVSYAITAGKASGTSTSKYETPMSYPKATSKGAYTSRAMNASGVITTDSANYCENILSIDVATTDGSSNRTVCCLNGSNN